MRVLRFVWNHWYIPALVLVGVCAFVVGHRKSPLSLADDAISAVNAGERARRLEATQGRDSANAAIEAEYRRDIDALESRQRRKAERLRGSPARRARYIARMSRKRGTDPI